MPRDKYGRSVEGYDKNEKESKEKEKSLEKSMDGHHGMLKHHMELHKQIQERLTTLEKHEKKEEKEGKE